MRLALACLTVWAVASSATAAEFKFSEPAKLSGTFEGQEIRWIAFGLPEGAQLDLRSEGPAWLVESNLTFPANVDTPLTYAEVPADSDSWSRPVSVSNVHLLAAPGGATVAMKVHGWAAAEGAADVVRLRDGGLPTHIGDGGVRHGWSFWSFLATRGVALVSTAPWSNLTFNSLDVQAIEWYNMDPHCDGHEECLPGGGRTTQQRGALGTSVWQEKFTFERLEGELSLSARLELQHVVLAGPSIDVTNEGETTLPAADGKPCNDCTHISGQTIRIEGVAQFANLRPEGAGFSAGLTGDFQRARLDETWVSPSRLGQVGAATAAALGLAVVVKIVFATLFTRLSKQEALEHPKRKTIFTYVQQHPGANFREVARNTGIASGTVRHHLTVLERAGHLVEHQHQGTVRLFENHGKFDQNWADVVLLREPALNELNDWVKAHGPCPQKDILEGMEQLGWSRSTTQHRLERLVEGGLVSIRLQGRLKIYSIAPRPTVKPVLGLPMLPPVTQA